MLQVTGDRHIRIYTVHIRTSGWRSTYPTATYNHFTTRYTCIHVHVLTAKDSERIKELRFKFLVCSSAEQVPYYKEH